MKDLQLGQKLDFRLLFRLIYQHPRQLIKAHFIAICAALTGVSLPLLFPLLIDEMLLDKKGSLLPFFQSFLPDSFHTPLAYALCALCATAFLRLIYLVLTIYQNRQFTIISKDITFSLRRLMLTKLELISMSEYETLGSGKVASSFQVDVDTVDNFIAESISKILISVLIILGVAGILLYLEWRLALFILLLNPFIISLSRKLGSKVKKLKSNENSALSIFQEALTETLDGIYQIRAANREKHYIERLVDKAAEVRHHSANYAWKSEAAGRASFTLFLLGVDLFRATAILIVATSDTLTIGGMFAVFSYLWVMMEPFNQLLGVQTAYYSAQAALGRINDLTELEEEPQYPQEKNPFTNGSPTLEITDLDFSYKEGPDILCGISARISAGEKVAFVGASGGGKSTLVQTLIGLYPIKNGSISYNGIPVEQIGFDRIREHVATVLQHPVLFNDSIRHNLIMGNKHSDADIWQALEIAQLDQTIKGMEDQLETLIGRNGVRLSGGQRQRLAIARMILAKPQVVILDEATSALDTETEEKLHRALNNFLQGRTTIIIAHRASAVRQADRIHVFENGKICQSGHHDQLIKEAGVYSRLYGFGHS